MKKITEIKLENLDSFEYPITIFNSKNCNVLSYYDYYDENNNVQTLSSNTSFTNVSKEKLKELLEKPAFASSLEGAVFIESKKLIVYFYDSEYQRKLNLSNKVILNAKEVEYTQLSHSEKNQRPNDAKLVGIGNEIDINSIIVNKEKNVEKLIVNIKKLRSGYDDVDEKILNIFGKLK